MSSPIQSSFRARLRSIALLAVALSSASSFILISCGSDDGTTPDASVPDGSTDGSSGGSVDSSKTEAASADVGAPQGSTDASQDAAVDSGDAGSQGDDDDDDGGTLDAGPDACGSAPRLQPTVQGFFCAFYRDGGAADAGGASNCTNDTTCCNPGRSAGGVFPPSYCAVGAKGDNGEANCKAGALANGSEWTDDAGTTLGGASASWECASSTSCGGKRCCATSAPGATAGNYVNVGPFVGSNPPPAACKANSLFKAYGARCAVTCGSTELELCSATDGCDNGKTCKPVRGPGSRDLGWCE